MRHRFTTPMAAGEEVTFDEVRTALRAVGMVITRDTIGSGPTGCGDYRVSFSLKKGVWPGTTRERAEELAYYTPYLDDAKQSGLEMAKTRREKQYR